MTEETPIKDENVYSSLGHGPSPFRPELFQFRIQCWGFAHEEGAYISLISLSNHLADFFADHAAVPSDWEELKKGDDLRLHLVPHQEQSGMIYPGFTMISEGYETLEEAVKRKEEFMQRMQDLTGAQFTAPN